jgi:hypothetical protein
MNADLLLREDEESWEPPTGQITLTFDGVRPQPPVAASNYIRMKQARRISPDLDSPIPTRVPLEWASCSWVAKVIRKEVVLTRPLRPGDSSRISCNNFLKPIVPRC